MWEFSIVASKYFIVEAKEISRKIKTLFSSYGVCSVVIEKFDVCVTAFALKKEHKKMFINQLNSILAQSIFEFYKQYTIKNIFDFYNISDEDIFELIYRVDSEIDLENINNRLDLNSEILYVDNFLQFKCRDMLIKWNKMSEILCQNYRLISSDSNKRKFIEIIKKNQENN